MLRAISFAFAFYWWCGFDPFHHRHLYYGCLNYLPSFFAKMKSFLMRDGYGLQLTSFAFQGYLDSTMIYFD